MFSRGMTRGDAYFHLLLAGCVIGGTLAAQSVGSSLWESNNRGVRPQVFSQLPALDLSHGRRIAIHFYL